YTLISIPLPYFFFTAPAPTDIYPLSLHDALPISRRPFDRHAVAVPHQSQGRVGHLRLLARDLLAAGRHRAVQGRGAGDECAATGNLAAQLRLLPARRGRHVVSRSHTGGRAAAERRTQQRQPLVAIRR